LFFYGCSPGMMAFYSTERHFMNLAELGWTPFFEAAWAKLSPKKDWMPGRVIAVHREMYSVLTAQGEFDARISGKFRSAAGEKSTFPTVGDWVGVSLSEAQDQLTLHVLLPRFTHFSRKVPGMTSEEQILAANIDTAFLVTSLDADFSPRRIERYLTTVYASGAAPVILLTKPDLNPNADALMAEMKTTVPSVPVFLINGLTGEGLDALTPHLARGKTAVLLGSSGVGKSALLNCLLEDEVQDTGEVREKDSKGRHITTHREMFLLPGGSWVIDNPGLREFQLWDSGQGVDEVFLDIAALTADCKFRNCAHESEPGCAVKKAVQEGTLDAARWASYEKLKKERAHLEKRVAQKAAIAPRKKVKEHPSTFKDDPE
jgi:ribosome biogenesis GTPase / thiamine phosphate phosphatase